MKKSIVLSIIMTLVMVVAMSTATFAWYSANSTASASGMALSASTAAGNVTIGHTAETISHTAISWVANDTDEDTSTAAQIANARAPMMPTAADLSNFATGVKAADGKITYSTGAECAKYTFFLSNQNSDAITLSISGTPSGDLVDHYEWAIVIGGNVISNSAYSYLTATTNGVTEDAKADVDAKTGTYTIGTNAIAVECTVYVWFAGNEMLNSDGGQSAALSISITQAVQG